MSSLSVATAATAASVDTTVTAATAVNNYLIHTTAITPSAAKLKTVSTKTGLVRYSFYVLVPLSAIAAVVFCKCSKTSRAEV